MVITGSFFYPPPPPTPPPAGGFAGQALKGGLNPLTIKICNTPSLTSSVAEKATECKACNLQPATEP
jgi:hypothetical protein